ncbi:hypothetical protein MLD38_020424 [Melastoma candidum]|uniref:Uncharacterized protein n=1 Tax=Melastoma candidum TaxID=119954 RepID=A0ACB9QE40_9MYRT|nr:hypothetical protein MLD38_020424 [Melastoma candidum]
MLVQRTIRLLLQFFTHPLITNGKGAVFWGVMKKYCNASKKLTAPDPIFQTPLPKAGSYALLTRPPGKYHCPSDLHVLSMPPTFILSPRIELSMRFIVVFLIASLFVDKEDSE